MIKEDDFAKSDITDWLRDPITVDFFNRVKALEYANNANVHGALSIDKFSQDSLYQAALFNAALDQLKEVQDIPEQMKIEIEEERNAREESNVGS